MGFLPSEAADGLDRVVDRGGIAGAVREEDAVGLEREDVLRREVDAGHDREPAPRVDEAAQDVALDAEVEDDDVVLRRARRGGRPRAAALGPARRAPSA